MKALKQHPMFPVFLVVFFGYTGLSLVFPIFSPMFLDHTHHFLPENYALKYRTVMLGSVLAAYPMGQFLGLPLLGELSDHYGRKRVLAISLCISFFGCILSALSILWHSFWFLFVARFISGYAEGNFCIAQSTAADISQGPKRVKNFGIINMAAGLGFVIGPIIGGKLADSSLVPWFGDDTPFWFSGVLAIFTLLMVLWQLPETKPSYKRDPRHKIHPLTGLVILYRNFSTSPVRSLFFVNFLFYFGVFFFYQYFPALLVNRFDFTPSKIADISAYIAVMIAFSQLVIVRFLAKYIVPKKATIFAALVLSPALFALTVNNLKIITFIALPFAAIFLSIASTNLQSFVSHNVAEDGQGVVMGVNYSMQVLGEVVTSLVGGFLAGFFLISMPLLLGGTIVFISAIALAFLRKSIHKH